MNTPASSTIVQRLWNYCNLLRDDGMSYGDYAEQMTYLLFFKMDHENRSMLGKASPIPAEFELWFCWSKEIKLMLQRVIPEGEAPLRCDAVLKRPFRGMLP